jgi:hypothetical protein
MSIFNRLEEMNDELNFIAKISLEKPKGYPEPDMTESALYLSEKYGTDFCTTIQAIVNTKIILVQSNKY